MNGAVEVDMEAEKDIDRWVSEFFLRRQQNPRVCGKRMLFKMKFRSEDCGSIRKSVVLRDIWKHLADGSVEEEILDLLELMEKLFVEEHCRILDSLKSAYCRVAVDCTVRYILVMDVKKGKYSDAVERIWAERIGALKNRKSELVTQELLKWEDDLKDAIEDPNLCRRIRETNTRYSALSMLSVFVTEQWALMDAPSLEVDAERTFRTKRKVNPELGNENDREISYGVQNGGSSERPGGGDDTCDAGKEQRGKDKEPRDNGVPVDAEKYKNDAVAIELKACLLEMLELVNDPALRASKAKEVNNAPNPSTTVSCEPSRNARDSSASETPQPFGVSRVEVGGQGCGSNAQENLNDAASETEGTSSVRARPHLPTPRSLNVSPLRRVQSPRPQRAAKRREKTNWTTEEIEALKEGVKNYGKSWKTIKQAYPDVLAQRTDVDCKDKWRNLVGR